MKCPHCNKEMKKGFVRAMNRGGICWVKDIDQWSAPREDDDFFKIGKSTWLTANHVPAFNCDSCEMIIIDYSEIK